MNSSSAYQVRLDNGTGSVGALVRTISWKPRRCSKSIFPRLVEVGEKRRQREGAPGRHHRRQSTSSPTSCGSGNFALASGSDASGERSSSRREIAAAAFFIDAYETSSAADEGPSEISHTGAGVQIGIRLPKFGDPERPSVGLAIALTSNGGISDAKIAVGCAGRAPKRVAEAEAMLKGKSIERRPVNWRARVKWRACRASDQ